MIYFDTVSGKLVIDTEIGRVSETIVITRSATGTSIKYVDLKSRPAVDEKEPNGAGINFQSFCRLLLRPVSQRVRGG